MIQRVYHEVYERHLQVLLRIKHVCETVTGIRRHSVVCLK
jgi:hypothetical protein